MNYHRTNKEILFVIICILFVVFAFGFMWHEHEDTVQYENMIRSNQMATKRNNYKTANYSKANVIDQYDKTEPNLNNAVSSAQKRLSQGLNLAYNHSQTVDLYNHNGGEIQSLLGDSVSKVALDQVKPQQNKAFKQTESYANKMMGMKIGFGRFDPVAKDIPINVIVEYKTPPYVGEYEKGSDKKEPHYFYSTFQIEYTPQATADSQFQLVHADNGENPR